MNFIEQYLDANLRPHLRSIDEWIFNKTPLQHNLIYSSFDIRNSGFKIVPIDANLFPAGFNNLSDVTIKLAQLKMQKFCRDNQYDTKNAIIIAESHTRNHFYFESLINLRRILSIYFNHVVFAHLGDEDIIAQTHHDIDITLYALRSLNSQNQVIVLNNDLTDGLVESLQALEGCVIPPIALGWYQRKKTSFFAIYQKLVMEFAHEFGIDAFYLTSLVKNCSNINFKSSAGIDCIAMNTEKALHLLRDKYKEHDVKLEPYVIIKSNSGTYGMNVMAARSGDDIYHMNKKRKAKMNSGKGGVITSDVIIQEGIETIETYNDLTAETMVYSIGAEPVSFIYRMHDTRDSKSNLNSPGMTFQEIDPNLYGKQFAYHSLVSRLSNLALILEINQHGDDVKYDNT